LIDHLADHDAALQRAQPVNPLGVSPGHIGEEWASTRRDEQLVESLPLVLTVFKLAHPHPAPLEIDFLDFVKRARIDVLFVAEDLRCTGDERIDVVDNLADVIGYPSGRVGSVRAAFEGHDL
jgi:hypothetical protein